MSENKFLAVLDRVSRYCALISSAAGGAFLFVMTMLIIVDVLLRFFAGTTTYVATEWAGYMLVGVGFLGLAYTQRRGRHIQIDMITSRLPSKVKKQVNLSILIVGTFFMGWLAWITLEPVIHNYVLHRTSLNIVKMPMWIPTLLVPVGLAMLTIELFLELVKAIWSKESGVAVQRDTKE